MAQKSTHSSDLSLTRDYQGFLRKTWLDCKVRDWKVYSAETFRKFWDSRNVVDKKK